MPTYDYECQSCNHTFELFQMMSAEPIKKCPKCGKNKVKRLIGPGIGIIFKGSGFYETDYKRKETNSSGGRSAENNSASIDKKPETKETKTDKKSSKATDAKEKNKKQDG